MDCTHGGAPYYQSIACWKLFNLKRCGWRYAYDKMLERANKVTGGDGYQHIEYARWADDLVILTDGHPKWNWLGKAAYKRLQEELIKLKVELNTEKTRIIDLTKGETFS
jgi:RNA-directed DNA polymerase